MSIERRYRPLVDAGDRVLEGVAVPYGAVAHIGGQFHERFEPDSIRFDDVVLNVMHDRSRPVARTPASLSFQALADGRGLGVRAALVDTGDGRDAYRMVQAGILRGFSIEFRSLREHPETVSGDVVRVIDEARLTGLAIVDTPAYDGASAEARALAERYAPPRRRRWH